MNKRDYVPTFSCAEVFIRHIYNNYSEAVVGSEIIFVGLASAMLTKDV